MGAKESRQFPLTYEEAVKRGNWNWRKMICEVITKKKLKWKWVSFFHQFYNRFYFSVTETERRRIQDAFRRLSAPSGYVSRQMFTKDVLGDGVPVSVADRIYCLCGSGSNSTTASSSSFTSTQSRGLSIRDTMAVLVLLTRGTSEEKTKCKTVFISIFKFQRLTAYSVTTLSS